ncbi:MAG: hypothetical protein AB1642_00385 [Pseudomonadota bacterium]
MNATARNPADRTAFNGAMDAIRADHATLRHLAATASSAGFPADDILSLADAMAAHERAEIDLLALPFIARAPETVVSTAARANKRCLEYVTGNSDLPESSAAAALFVEALLAHLTAEEAWLDHERELKNERMWTAI